VALNDRPYHRLQTVSNDTGLTRGPSTPRGRATTFRPISGVSRVYGVTSARSQSSSDSAPCRGARTERGAWAPMRGSGAGHV